jgi:hypothetical protein
MTRFILSSRRLITMFAVVLCMAAALLGHGTTHAAPKAITLTALKLQCSARAMHLLWETDMERYTTGYHVYRSTSKVAIGERVNQTMIPKNGGNGAGSYIYSDRDVVNGQVYYYHVESVGLRGDTTLHGPVSSTFTCGVSGTSR